MQLKKLIVQSIFWRGLYLLTVLLLNVFVARFFEAAGSGWIYYVSSFYALVIVVLNLSLDSAMGFYISRKEVSVSKLLLVSVSWTFIVGLIVFFGAIIYLRLNAGLAVSSALLLSSSLCYVCGNLLTNYSSIIFYSNKNFYVPNIVGICCNLLLTIVLASMAAGATHSLKAENFLHIYFFGFIVQGVILVAAVLYTYTDSARPSIITKIEFRKVFHYAMMAFAGNIIFFLVYRVDYFFVKYYCNAADLGNYIQVSKLGQMVILIPSIMAKAVFPMVAGGQKEEVKRSLKLLSRISLLVMGIFCLMVALTGNWLFAFVFGRSFDRMFMPFVLLTPGVLSLSSLYPLAAYYSGKNRQLVNILGSLLALIFIVVADLIFIPGFGINAAALISSLGYMLYHGYVLMVFRKEYKTSLAGFFFLKKSDLTWLKQQLTTRIGIDLVKEA